MVCALECDVVAGMLGRLRGFSSPTCLGVSAPGTRIHLR
jgi:hypothetical protein